MTQYSAFPLRPWAVLLAAGSGSRLAAATGNIPKQFLQYHAAPLYWQSALHMRAAARIAGLIFVFPPDRMEEETTALHRLDARHILGLPWLTAPGGPRRQDSVRNALACLPPACPTVLVHDTARPFASPALIVRICEALDAGEEGVVPGVPVTDTIKIVHGRHVRGTPDRETLTAVQTPQGFRLSTLLRAHEQACREQWSVTDDAALLERCGVPVAVVPGDPANIKITHPEDLRMLHDPAPAPLPCTGLGYDVHRYAPGRPMKLGGVPIPGGPEVQAHSDGDVLLHALMDALLGCAGAGDIGRHFPDTEAAFDNIDSAVLLDDVLRIVREACVTPVHVDVTIIAQVPKIAPHRDAIHRNLVRLLGLPPERINVKATTEEGLGFTGAREGIKAVAVVAGLRPALFTNPPAEQAGHEHFRGGCSAPLA